MPRLVVAMPSRNAEETIDLALSSTIKALPKDALIVVWNDGSSDATSSIAHSYENKKVLVLDSPESVGGGKARMEILRRTDSEFVANMDADDFCLPWRFSVQQRHMQGVDVSFSTTFKFADSHFRMRPPRPLAYGPAETAIALALYNPLPHPTMYARRATLEGVGGYRDLRTAQDYDLWLRTAATGARLGRLALPTVAYRQSLNQVTRQVGYADGIRTNPLIRDSYVGLLEFLRPGSSDFILEDGISEVESEVRIKRTVTEALETLQPRLRNYHRKVIARGLAGPFL